MKGKRPRLLLVHPDFRAIGGGEVVAAWALEALKSEYEISVLTWNRVAFEELNDFFGTSLNSADFQTIQPSRIQRSLIDLAVTADLDPWSIQRYSMLMRVAKKLQPRFDLIFTTFNEADIGGHGLQYVHYPWSHRHLKDPDAPAGARRSFPLGVMLRPWRIISGFSVDRMRSNVTIVNSDWTASRMGPWLDVPTETVYPPVPGDFPEYSWEVKRDAFICAGRITPTKSFEQIIEIVRRLRDRGNDLELHIVGRKQDSDLEYAEHLARVVAANTPWASLHIDVRRGPLLRLMAEQRYGIHAYLNEPFGIALAEMVRAGCIVFGPNSGGQVEILGGDHRLLYDSVEDAVDKIHTVLHSATTRSTLRAHLAAQGRLFTTELFVENIRRIVGKRYAVGS